MCQYNDIQISAELNRTLQKEGFIYAYKVVCKHLLITPRHPCVLGSMYYSHRWKIGTNISESYSPTYKEVPQLPKSTAHGFHVYLDKPYWYIPPANRVIKVKCKKEDFVSAGIFNSTKTAVFNAVELSKEEYDKAIR